MPDDTARVARAAFRRCNPCLLLRDQLRAVFDDAGFADLCPKRGQPAYAPWRLALVTLLQFREGLSDRQAAEAVRARIDWKYLLALDLADPGFDHSLLCEFRGRLLGGDATERLLARVLDAAREAGLLKARGRHTDSTHVLAAVRERNRIELLAETLRAALNVITVAAPDWLRTVAHPEWYERYGRRIEDRRLPETGPKRDAYVVQVGTDGYRLLDALAGKGAPADAAALPAVAVLRRVWARHFERDEGGQDDGVPRTIRLRQVDGRGPGDRIESPYDADPRYRSKSSASWTGYMVHLMQACAWAPRTASCTPIRRRPACTRPCASRRSTRRWPPRAWPRPSTWWTRRTSAPTTSSGRGSSTTSTWSARGGPGQAGRPAPRARSTQPTSPSFGKAKWPVAPRAGQHELARLPRQGDRLLRPRPV